jgi:hypothetical protein
MRTRIILLMLSITFYNCYADAGITREKAKTVAETYYRYTTNYSNAIGRISYTDKDDNGNTLYYIVDMDNSGFVIVSGTAVTHPIIAISTNGSYKAISKSGVEDYLYNLHNHISKLYQLNMTPQENITSEWNQLSNGMPLTTSRSTTSVSPLLTTTWNQSPYYNDYCPGGSVTGCVATAMAQIVKYWNYPATGTGSYSYSDPPYGTLSSSFDSTINWSIMPASLSSSTPTNEINAVASLMYKLGVSVAMAYSPSGSGAYVLQSEDPGGPCAQYSYVNYFGYNSSTMQGLVQANYTTSAWDSILNIELNNSRPVEYVGYGSDGGHTWVVDGYNTSGLYDMNWGWGGLDNGYFALNDLDPSGIPLGSDNAMLIGIEPSSKQPSCSEPTSLAASSITTSGAVISWVGSGSAKSYNLNYQVSGASSWTSLTEITSVSYSLSGLTAGTAYNVEVQQVCTNSESSSFTGTVTFNTTSNTISYCTSSGTTTSEYIKTVKFGSINNTVSNDGGYHNYTNLSTDISAGTNYKLTVTPGFTSTSHAEYWSVYIDYNHTGDFVLVREGRGTGSVSASISVPATAVSGATRMRIIMHRGSYITSACSSFTNGDVQDYTVVISNSADLTLQANDNDSINAVQDISGVSVNVFPNPTSSVLNIKYLNNIDVTDITLVDATGKILLKSPSKLSTLDFSKYAQGWYILVITESDGSVSRQLVMVTR